MLHSFRYVHGLFLTFSQFIFGISAFDDKAKIDLAVNVDFSGEVDLALYANAKHQVGGNADVFLNLLVTSSATGNFFSIWKDQLIITLYKQKFEIWRVSYFWRVQWAAPLTIFSLQKTFLTQLRRDHARDVLTLPPAPRNELIPALDKRDDFKCFTSYGEKISLFNGGITAAK